MLDTALRAEYQTYLEPLGGATRIHAPEFQKRDRVKLVRTEISDLSMKWFNENVPGLFCSGLLEGKLPTCELIFLKEAEPFPPRLEGQDPPPGYLRLLGLDAGFEVWESASSSGLKFKPSGRRDQDNQYHSILSMNESAISNSLPEYYTGDEKCSMFHSLNMSFPNIFNLWAIIALLEGYTRNLGRTRDSASFRLGANQNTIETLDSLGDNVSFSLDVSAVTADLMSSAKTNFSLFGPIEKFTECNPGRREKEILGQILLAAISEEAKRLRKMDRSIRNHLTQFGSLLAAAENVRLQRRITNLTRTVLVAAVVVPLLTWLASEDFKWLKSIWACAGHLWPW